MCVQTTISQTKYAQNKVLFREKYHLSNIYRHPKGLKRGRERRWAVNDPERRKKEPCSYPEINEIYKHRRQLRRWSGDTMKLQCKRLPRQSSGQLAHAHSLRTWWAAFFWPERKLKTSHPPRLQGAPVIVYAAYSHCPTPSPLHHRPNPFALAEVIIKSLRKAWTLLGRFIFTKHRQCTKCCWLGRYAKHVLLLQRCLKRDVFWFHFYLKP